MKYEKNKKLSLYELIEKYFIFSCFFCGIFSTFFKTYNLLVVIILALSILLLIRVRKNILLLIAFGIILYCNYSILMLMFINPLNGSRFVVENYTKVGYISLQILFLFMFIIYMFMPKKIDYLDRNKLYYSKDINKILHFINVVLILLITFCLRTKSHSSTIWGYAILFLLLGLYFSKNDKKIKFMYLIVGFLFCVKSVLTNGRLYMTQSLIILFVYFFPKKYETRLWLLIPIMVALYTMFNFISVFRVNELATFGELLKLTFDKNFDYMFSADTALSAFYTGQTYVMQSMVDPITQRLYMFILFVVSIFTGSSILPQSLLAEYTRQYYIHFYGGVYPYYGWYYMGFLGVVLFALFLVLIIRKIFIKQKFKLDVFVPIMVLIVSSTFLWYLYHPSSLIRSPLLLALIFYGVVFANSVLNKIKNRTKK